MPMVERDVRDGRQIIVLRYAAVFYWLMWPTIGISIWAAIASTRTSQFSMIAAWMMLIATAIPYWPVVFEIRRKMRTGSITATGSKYSFANPITYSWATDAEEGAHNR